MSATNGTHYEQLHQGRTKMYKSKVDVVLGAQWGDEGKGKVVDMLASDVDIVCRCQVRTGHNREGGKSKSLLRTGTDNGRYPCPRTTHPATQHLRISPDEPPFFQPHTIALFGRRRRMLSHLYLSILPSRHVAASVCVRVRPWAYLSKCSCGARMCAPISPSPFHFHWCSPVLVCMPQCCPHSGFHAASGLFRRSGTGQMQQVS